MSSISSGLLRALRWSVLGSGSLALVFLSALPLDLPAQALGTTLFLAGLWLLGRAPRTGFQRILFLGLAGFVVLRYLSWRTLHTLGYHGLPDFAGTLTLYLAEVYGIFMFLLGAFVNARRITRQPAPWPIEAERLPTVDIFIPTYDEDPDLVKVTLTAASLVWYPRHKRRVYLLDDGGTLEKRSAPDPVAAARARSRAEILQQTCREVGAQYLTRAHNRQAKSGNLNAALARTEGEVILVLDADHVPAVDILQNTVGYFLRDDKLFLVQTPHFFINPDPLERNLQTHNRMPAEAALFYGAVQRGLDFWQSSFFCGSAALIRRRSLEECGGFSGETITEDAESALLLHSRGWRSLYLDRPMISGLQPETFSSFVVQRSRWAQGMVQLFLLRNPLRVPGLKIWQRLSYLSNMLFWFFPFARVIFLTAPVLYLVFGLKIYEASVAEIIGYTIPYLLGMTLARDYLFGRVRWFLVSDIYETMQSLFSLRAVMATIRDPRSPRFKITPKRELLATDFVSPLATPFYWLLGSLSVGVLAGVYHLYAMSGERGYVIINLLWSGFNVLILLACLGGLFEQRQRRASPRLPVDLRAELLLHGRVRTVRLTDISVGGAQAVLAASERPDTGDPGRLWIRNPGGGHLLLVDTVIANVRSEAGQHLLGIRFKPRNLVEYCGIVLLVHGDNRRGRAALGHPGDPPSWWQRLVFLVSLGVRQGCRHLAERVATGSRRRRHRRIDAAPPVVIGARQRRRPNPAAPVPASERIQKAV